MLPDHLTECWQLRRLEITRLVPHHHLNRQQSQGHQQSSTSFLLGSCDEEETACYAYTALHYAALYYAEPIQCIIERVAVRVV